MTELTTLEQYSDADGNSIVFPGSLSTKINIKFVGKNNKLIVHPKSRIGNLTVLFDCDNGLCEIGQNSYRGTIRIGEKSHVSVGDGVTVIGACYISAVEHSAVTIGDDCMLGAQNEIRADDAHPIFDVATGERINIPKSIRIGNHVWLSTRAIVLGGAEIGDGSIIGHSSLVKGFIPNNCTAAGVPAKVLRRNCAWERPHLSLTRPHFKPNADAISKSQYWRETGMVSEGPTSVDLANAKSPNPDKTTTKVKSEKTQGEPAVSTVRSVHPYSSLPDRSFWKRSIGTRNPLNITDLYRKKFSISPQDRIVTAGSCFAQHIARKLRASGFNFCDYEPAPPLFPKDKHSQYNYGVYSARYCNIYTIRQLLQTYERAFGLRESTDSIWHGEHGFQDAFRPVVEPAPFSTEEDLLHSRRSHLSAVRKVFENSDLFVFTLGLTEGWVSKEDGSVYPLCPGTVGGQFDKDLYEFINFGFSENYSDMMLFIEHLKKRNPSVKILLTVSPVPLTATKADDNVMVATSYSKSVLRAVAGQVASEHDFVDYFPSYEIISAPPMRGMFYEPNMRSVTPAGVDFVMSHFFSEHRPVTTSPLANVDKQLDSRPEEHDEVCEEMLLDQDL